MNSIAKCLRIGDLHNRRASFSSVYMRRAIATSEASVYRNSKKLCCSMDLQLGLQSAWRLRTDQIAQYRSSKKTAQSTVISAPSENM